VTAPTLNPAPVLIESPATAADLPCPDFCDGNCDGWTDDEDGTRFHAGDYGDVSAVEQVSGYKGVGVSLTRLDSLDGPGAPQIHLMTGTQRITNDDWALTPADARKLAAALLNAADDAEPLPTGEQATFARDLRIGDVLLTPDGWQRIYMVLIDESANHAAAFTPERDDMDCDGWKFELGSPVTVRRAVAS
jgi:hypothetical protein